jgi:hypothetical protein
VLGGRGGSVKLDTLIGIPEAARLAKEPIHKMRRRLKRLAARCRRDGAPPVLYMDGRHLMVRVEALQLEMRTPEAASRIEALESAVGHVEGKVDALKNSHLAEKRRQKKRWDIQERMNRRFSEQDRDIKALSRL